jgi:hypothetical protein
MDANDLYDADFVAWTGHQAAALRRLADLRINLGQDLDLGHLAEEIEDLGKRDKRSVVSALARLFEHLIKLQFSALAEPRAQWRISAKKQRDRLADLLKDSPSLRAHLLASAGEAYARGRDYAAAAVDMADVPADPPWPIPNALDPDWWPANRHGLTDPEDERPADDRR